MAKSVLSLLVGCALDDGLLRSIDQPVTELVPELKSSGFRSVTLRHLLQMTSGIDYAENDNPFGLHVPVSQRDCAISPRTVMNNAGYEFDPIQGGARRRLVPLSQA